MRRAPLKAGDTVTTYLRPDLRYTVVDFNHKAHMVQLAADAGDRFWVSRNVLTVIEGDA